MSRRGYQGERRRTGREDSTGPSRLLTVREAAEFLSIHPKTLYRLKDAGLIPSVGISVMPRAVRFDEDVIRRLRREKEAKATVRQHGQ